MKTFIIERKLLGAGNMSAEELRDLSKRSVDVTNQIGKPYTWVESFVIEDAICCVHEAETQDVIQENSAICQFPINKVEEVRAVIGPETASR